MMREENMPAAQAPTWDAQRLKQERIARLQAEMRRLGVGALYISDGVSLQYVLNTKIPGAKLFVPAQGEPVALVRPRDAGYVALLHEHIVPPFYNNTWEPQNDAKLARFAQGIKDLMAQHGVAGEPLGVDPLEAPAFHALLQAGIAVTDARPAIEYAKSIKTQDEIAIYRLIGEQYRETYLDFRNAIRPGVSEKDLAAVVVGSWHSQGGEEVRQLNVCSGEHMNPWRRWPTDRTLQPGEFVGIDFHGRSVNGIQGDVSRTYLVAGQPSEAQRDLYRRSYEYLEAVTDIFRAGRPLGEVVASVPQVPEQYYAQLYNYNVAHPIGMTPSGYPMLNMGRAQTDDALRENQVFAIECYFGAKGSPLAVKLEHMIRVREGEPEVLDAQVPIEPW